MTAIYPCPFRAAGCPAEFATFDDADAHAEKEHKVQLDKVVAMVEQRLFGIPSTQSPHTMTKWAIPTTQHSPKPKRLYAGRQLGFYFIKVSKNTPLQALQPIVQQGYRYVLSDKDYALFLKKMRR